MTAPALLNYRYKIIKALAEGGFGKTFLAEDTQMPSRRKCVIKQLKPVINRPAIAQIVQERFTREAAVLDSVGERHSQIPTLYAYFVVSDQFYLVQEWIDGEPLLVAEHQMWSEARVRKLLKAILPAIAHIHKLNVIHRDIKPDNIILRRADDLPCLIDFGAVKEVMTTVISATGTPKSSIVIGTAGYMPQEQAAGRPTFSSDLYSLGMTAICLLTGKTPAALPRDRQTGRFLWQSSVPTLSAELGQILSRAIHPLPQHRYTTAADMLKAVMPEEVLLASRDTLESPGLTASKMNRQPSDQQSSVATSKPLASVFSIAAQSAQQTSQQTVQQPSQWTRVGIAPAAVFMLGAGLFWSVGSEINFGSASPTSSSSESPTSETPNSDNSTSSVSSDSLLSEDPQTAAEFTERAVLLYEQGREQQALEAVEAALSLDPNAIEALSLKGDILVNQSRMDMPGAIAAYTQALDIDPNNTDLLKKRCKAYQESNDWDLAHQDCTRFLSLSPNNAEIYDRRGDIRVEQENYIGAIEDYSQAIEINEQAGNQAANQSIYFSRCMAYNEAGDPAKGLEDLEKFRQTR